MLFSIDRRLDQHGLPYQFYIQFKRPDGEERVLNVLYDQTGATDVPGVIRDLRGIADGIEGAYEREMAK